MATIINVGIAKNTVTVVIFVIVVVVVVVVLAVHPMMRERYIFSTRSMQIGYQVQPERKSMGSIVVFQFGLVICSKYGQYKNWLIPTVIILIHDSY